MPKVAIVILNWNGKKYLEKFLPILQEKTKGDFEIIIADNDSKDESITYLVNQHPELRIIKLDNNYGFTGGYNRALAQIDATYYVILNSDIEVTDNWLEPLIEFLDKNENVGACMPKIKSWNQPEMFEYAGASGGFIDKYGYPFCRGRILDNLEKDNNQYQDIIDIFWATGACLIIRSKLFHELDGFDDDFFAHMEEIDLCWRLKNKGSRIVVVPASQVYHVGGGTLPNNNPFKLYLNYRNNLYLLYKNLPKGKLTSTIIVRIMLDIVSAFLYLLQGKVNFFAAVIKAHKHFFKHRKKLQKERKEQLKNGCINTSIHPEVYKKSIILSYFIKGKKDFKSLDFPLH